MPGLQRNVQSDVGAIRAAEAVLNMRKSQDGGILEKTCSSLKTVSIRRQSPITDQAIVIVGE
jgi:hypothetical protein